MTFSEHVERYTPSPGMALIEPWHAGGTLKSGIVVTHHTDLPTVFAFVWRLPVGYTGLLFPGCLIIHPRYAYETFVSGNDPGPDGNPTPWSLGIIAIDEIEAIVDLEDVLI